MATIETDLFVQPSPKGKGLAQKWSDFRSFLWNAENKQFMGRNGRSWALIGIFYIVFYFSLGLFFMTLWKIFYLTVDPHKPTVILGESLIGTSPGLSVYPRPKTNGNSVISYTHGNPTSWIQMKAEIDHILSAYENRREDNNTVQCEPGLKDSFDHRVCLFDLSVLGNVCTKNNSYGFTQGHLCLLLKLNKVFRWEPILYTDKDIKNLGNPAIYISDKYIPISCTGVKAEDNERLGEVHYYPDGFPIEYFPYVNQKGYLSPLLMVHFKNMIKNVNIHIECRAWAKNIIYQKQPRMGSFRLEVRINEAVEGRELLVQTNQAYL